MRFLVIVIFLIIAYYALREPQKGSGLSTTVKDNVAGTYGETHLTNEADPNAAFESSFEEGLPKDYIPSDIAYYSDIQKLKDDYDYRWNKLHRHFEEEKKELKANKDYSKEKMDELILKQEKAKKEYNERHKTLRDKFLKRIEEEKSSRDKGLR